MHGKHILLSDSWAGGYISVTNGTCNRSFFCLPGYVSSNNASVHHDKLDDLEDVVPRPSFSNGVDLIVSRKFSYELLHTKNGGPSAVKVDCFVCLCLVRFWRVQKVTRVPWMWPATRGRFPSWRQAVATRSALLEWQLYRMESKLRTETWSMVKN